MNKPIHDMTVSTVPHISTEIAAAKPPFGIGDDVKHTPQTLLDAGNELVNADVLEGTEKVTVIQTGSAKATTVDDINDIGLFLAMNYF